MKAFITRQLPAEALTIVHNAGNIEVDVWPGENPPSPADLRAHLQKAEGLLCLLTDRIDEALLADCPGLRAVSQMAVGYDNIDIAACTRHGVSVGNTPGVLTETTADLAFALLLATARRIPESEQFLRTGQWQTWSPMLLTGPDVHHATLGIIGMGRIGYEMARRAHGFEMKLLYSGTRRNETAERDFGATFTPMDSLLAESDFVSLHTPLNSSTRYLIGADQLGRMKPTAILINTARGAVLDTAALVDALRERRIAAAGLDVFETEPLPQNDPLLRLDNVVLLPHIGSASIATRTKMAILAAENLVAGLQRRRMPHPLNEITN